MIDELSQILLVYGYLPLSHFASWLGPLLSTYVISDVLISLSYFSMPVALAYFAWRCPDFHYRWLLRLLAVFLVACGATYLMDVIILWRPFYGLNTLIREIAAVASVVTSIMLWPYIHRTIKLPNINRLRQTNEELQREIAVRKGVEKDLNVARRAAESGLQKEHILMAAIVESSEDAIVGRTLDGIITSWNPSAQRIFGYSAQEIVGQSVLVLFPLELCVEFETLISAIREGRSIKQFRSERICKNGERIDVSLTVSPIRDESGQIIGSSSIVRDISERIQAESMLRIAATAFDSQQGIVVTDAGRMILKVNHSFTEITGYTAEETVGRNSRLLKSGHHNASFYNEMWESIKRIGSWEGEIWNRRKNGEVYPEWLMITAVKDDKGLVTHYVGTFTDITSRKTAEEEINNLAFYDPLTRLPNRRLLFDRLQQAMASSARSKQYGALLLLDLDNFKALNDTLGHDIGDLLLQQVAKHLATCVREGDTVARLGGDEFVVMLEDLSESSDEAATQAETVGKKILTALNQTYQLASYAHHSTPSIGATLFVDHHNSIDDLLKRADLAMYQAKDAGRNTLRFFDPEMQAVVTKRVALESALREGILKNQFLAYYQAQVDNNGFVTGAEVLLRWQHPQRGLVSPLEFIPLSEDTGLIISLGGWVFETACAQLVLWEARPETAHLTVAVNVSARQFHHKDFFDQVMTILDHTGANPKRLKLELTEGVLLDNVEDTITKMARLRTKGICFSLDDFGTGYSSLSYLKRLPFDQLKIDQSFVRDILTDPDDSAIARTVISLGKNLGLEVVAEGVETEAQRHFLVKNGCNIYQGYLFSCPLPLDGFEQIVNKFNHASGKYVGAEYAI